MTLSKRKMIISIIVDILSFIVGMFIGIPVLSAAREWIYRN